MTETERERQRLTKQKKKKKKKKIIERVGTWRIWRLQFVLETSAAVASSNKWRNERLRKTTYTFITSVSLRTPNPSTSTEISQSWQSRKYTNLLLMPEISRYIGSQIFCLFNGKTVRNSGERPRLPPLLARVQKYWKSYRRFYETGPVGADTPRFWEIVVSSLKEVSRKVMGRSK